MTYEFKRRVCKEIFCFFLLFVQSTTTHSADVQDGTQITGRAKPMESCLLEECGENLICSNEFICECRPGYRISNNYCVPFAEENEPCQTQEDCCGKLLCIKGICRKPFPTSDFLNFSKICVGITVTALIIAVFSTLIKYIVRYDRSRAFERYDNSPSSSRFSGSVQSNQRRLQEIRDEKPPSYDECVRVGLGNSLIEPPPYTNATNTATFMPVRGISNGPNAQAVNLSVVNQSNSTPLNALALYHDLNANLIPPQNSEPIQKECPASARK